MIAEPTTILMSWREGDPPFSQDVIFDTEKGVVAGQLIRIDSRGRHYKFWTDNQIYYGNARPKKWMPYPESPEKLKK